MEIAQQIRMTVQEAFASLQDMPPEQYNRVPGPGKWSPKQIMGHLIDSAANNHQRFVRAQWQDDLVFPGYQQEKWVEVQAYQQAEWQDIIGLWRDYNLHLARVIERIPEEVLYRPHHQHSLDRIAWQTVPTEEPATLAYFIEDYLGHMQHHLRQVFAEA